ncbi:MAG: type II toxin-antitoxin system prevent-host-death family antitoxin [Thermodesulfobacteriota bacterium]
MHTAAVSELKASLSEFLARVKAGEEVVVTERGRPVARLVPLARAAEGFPPHLLDLERAGRVRLGQTQIPEDFWTLPRPQDPRASARRALLAEREDGR